MASFGDEQMKGDKRLDIQSTRISVLEEQLDALIKHLNLRLDTVPAQDAKWVIKKGRKFF